MELTGAELRDLPGALIHGMGVRCSPVYSPPLSGDVSTIASDFLPASILPAFRVLAESLFARSIAPALKAESRDTFVRAFGESWSEFFEGVKALGFIAQIASSGERADILASKGATEITRKLRERVVALAGSEAEHELDFASSTYLRALRVASQIMRGGPSDPRHATEDMRLATRFVTSATVYLFGQCCLLAAAETSVAPGVVTGAFELLRVGALNAYSAAREALDLRVEPSQSENLDPGLVDAQDLELADADLDPLA